MIRPASASVYGPKRPRTGPKSYKKKMGKLPLRRSPKMETGFPKLMNFKHKYFEDFNLFSSTSSGNYIFSCNGMFDPNISGTGHQPMLFDQMAVLYDHYTVIASKIKWTIIQENTTGLPPYIVTVLINDDVTGTGLSGTREQTTSQNKLGGSVSTDPLVFYQNWSAYSAFGPAPLANNSLQGTPTANPVEQQYYQIILRAGDQVTSVTVRVMVELEYTCVWAEPKDVNSS